MSDAILSSQEYKHDLSSHSVMCAFDSDILQSHNVHDVDIFLSDLELCQPGIMYL